MSERIVRLLNMPKCLQWMSSLILIIILIKINFIDLCCRHTGLFFIGSSLRLHLPFYLLAPLLNFEMGLSSKENALLLSLKFNNGTLLCVGCGSGCSLSSEGLESAKIAGTPSSLYKNTRTPQGVKINCVQNGLKTQCFFFMWLVFCSF